MKYLAVIICLLPKLCLAQALPIPAAGFYNTNLEQINILECDNGNPEKINLNLNLKNYSGQSIKELTYEISSFGSQHIILNDLASIFNSFGSYTLALVGSTNLANRISCRTAFYRLATAGATKKLDFAYAIPVRAALTGDVGGLFNSYNPSSGPTPTYNWLSVINMSESNFSFTLEIYNSLGNLISTQLVSNLAVSERRDIGLGVGQTNGIYRIRPNNNNQAYDAFVVRYGTNNSGFDFAFPLRAQKGACSDTPVQISTMGNGKTQNWLEVFNLGTENAQLNISFKNRNGELLKNQAVSLPAFGQSHIYASSIIDPQSLGNVGSASLSCNDQNSLIVLQSAFYGRTTNKVEWAYAVQNAGQESANEAQQLTVPINTFLGMSNWFKAANLSANTVNAKHSVINLSGQTVGNSETPLLGGGTVDIGIHEISGFNFAGSLITSGDSGKIAGEVLRVLPKNDGQIGYIMHIPASVQPYTTPPNPPSGYFPSDSVWYQDISQAPLDSQSSQVIQWLSNAGGWGTGTMRIDYSIEVLKADANTPFKSFIKTNDFFEPDCDYAQVPIPVGGAIEGESAYQCISDGDCHLIVEHRATNKLYEMWRANIVNNTFYGGCLAVWNMTKVYGPSGRGENCTSADAAGFPIAPLLFTADEVAAGSINHAIRFILPNSRIRNGVYLHPATHSTSATSGGSNAPPYGTRLRLRADFPLSSLPNEGARVVARAMQKYGIILSDGGSIALTAQSDRFTTAKWEGLLGTRDLGSIQVSDFEMINGGTRIPYTGDCVRNP